MGVGRNVYRVLVGKPEGKRPLERPRCRWEDGIKMDRREIGWGGVEWIYLAQDRDLWRALVNAVMNLRDLEPRREPVNSTLSSMSASVERRRAVALYSKMFKIEYRAVIKFPTKVGKSLAEINV
jgi:hypothetical protein